MLARCQAAWPVVNPHVLMSTRGMPVRRGRRRGSIFPRQPLRMSGQGHNAAVFAPHMYNPGWGLNVLQFNTCQRAVSWKMSALGAPYFRKLRYAGLTAGYTGAREAFKPCRGP